MSLLYNDELPDGPTSFNLGHTKVIHFFKASNESKAYIYSCSLYLSIHFSAYYNLIWILFSGSGLQTQNISFHTFPLIFIIHTWWTNITFIHFNTISSFLQTSIINALFLSFKDGNLQKWRKSIKMDKCLFVHNV